MMIVMKVIEMIIRRIKIIIDNDSNDSDKNNKKNKDNNCNDNDNDHAICSNQKNESNCSKK